MKVTMPFRVGRSYFVRTVTYHTVGKLRSIDGGFLHFVNASWIADSGRFMNTFRDGTLGEVEPVGECWVAIAAIVDAFPWMHPLPDKQI